MTQEPNGYNYNGTSTSDDQGKNIYLQIATPKSPNSDGFSPTEIHDEQSLEDEIKQNVTNQIDLEILLKHREYNLVQNEISKVQNQLDTLQKLHSDPGYAKYLQGIIDLKEATRNEFTQQYYNTEPSEMITRRHSIYGIRKSLTEGDAQKPHRTSYGGLRPVVDSQGNKICVHKRSDGVIVKIECPTCSRSDFGSAQGFLNHSRLAHQVEYKSQDHAALVCGTVLPDSEQDEVGITSLRKLEQLGSDVNKNLAPDVGSIGGGSVNSEDLAAAATNVLSSSGGPQKKKARRSISKPAVSSGYLEKYYSKVNGTGDDNNGEFKEIFQDVTTKTDLDFGDEDESASPPVTDSTTDNKLFKKGHNRRKSRGGLSAVTFEDQDLQKPVQHLEELERLSPGTSTTQELLIEESSNSSTVRFSENSITYSSDPSLTPAQRRRVPTIPNPLRTRSRSSRENSN